MGVQKYNFHFKGIKCSVWINALCGENFKILIRTEKKLSKQEQQALLSYLEAEGYIYNKDVYLE
jgi:hypothetical protein